MHYPISKTFFTLLLCIFISGTSLAQGKALDKNDTYRQLDLFGDVFERARSFYVDDTADKDLIKNALNGMLSSLDPHSSYLDEDDFTDMRVQTKGEFGGLGIEVTMENGVVKVVSPIDDTPAFKAGIEAGDYISELDGEAVMGLSLSEAVDKMRGKVGTTIDLTVIREGEKEPLDIKIKRDVIKIRPVRSRIESNNIGYIRVTTFNQNTANSVKKAVKDLDNDAETPLVGYVLDLRNNPGGLLDQAIEVADIFLERGEIVSTRGRDDEDAKRDNATPGDLIKGAPMVALINSGSASASEIVAGALQDHRRAIIVGTKSFGKGSVQTIIPIPGHGAMRLTTARYYTPSGRSIQAKGIEPDIEVKQANLAEIDDNRLRENDLKGALDSKKSSKDKDVDETSKTITDYQLLRAVDLLRGLAFYEGKNIKPMADLAKNDQIHEKAQ